MSELLVWCVVQDWTRTYVVQVPESYAKVGYVAVIAEGICRDYDGFFDEDPFRVLAVCYNASSRREAEMVMQSMEEVK